jgi:hypothetical protein
MYVYIHHTKSVLDLFDPVALCINLHNFFPFSLAFCIRFDKSYLEAESERVLITLCMLFYVVKRTIESHFFFNSSQKYKLDDI